MDIEALLALSLGLNNVSEEIIDSEQLLIQQIIIRRNIQWLCHFTPRQNLENIKRFGLLTRNKLAKDNAVVTDPKRYDPNPHSICLSISKPNIRMFNRKLNEQNLDLCLLLVSPSILYQKKCLFYPHNAATASYRDVPNSSFMGEKALENLFASTIIYQKVGCEPQLIKRDWNPYLSNFETTSDQAEVQCLENVEPHYIMHIFEDYIPLNYADINYFMNLNKVIRQALGSM